MRDIDIATGVGLTHAKEGQVDPATAVEVELFDRGNDRVGILCRAKQRVVKHPAIVNALFDAHPQGVADALFGNHAENAAGNAEAEVERKTGAQFHRGTAGDDASFEFGRDFCRRRI